MPLNVCDHSQGCLVLVAFGSWQNRALLPASNLGIPVGFARMFEHRTHGLVVLEYVVGSGDSVILGGNATSHASDSPLSNRYSCRLIVAIGLG